MIGFHFNCHRRSFLNTVELALFCRKTSKAKSLYLFSPFKHQNTMRIDQRTKEKIIELKDAGLGVTDISDELGITGIKESMARMLKTCLKRWPLQTNVGIYATFYTAAELSQQTFNKYHAPERPDIDFRAAARIVAVGSFLYAPTLFYWYRVLDGKFPGNSPRMVATKVVLDQACVTPILLAIFFIIMGYLEGKDDIYSELRNKYKTAFMFNQCFWIPGQTINFALMPPNMRIVFISCASFLWINVLCFIKRQKVVENPKEL